MEDIRHEDFINDNEDLETSTTGIEQPETIPANDPANNAFHERLNSENDFYDDDFIRSIDPEQNPYIDDQLDDENLQHEAESDYK